MQYFLLLLYTYQGTLIAILTKLIPILLAEKGFNFEEQGLYSIVNYAFQLKILCAPLIDIYYIKIIGKRKTYLLPITFCIISLLLLISFKFQQITYLSYLSLICCLLLGIQDIVIDALAIDMIDKTERNTISTIQNVSAALGSQLFGNLCFMILDKLNICSFEQYLRIYALLGVVIIFLMMLKVNDKKKIQQENKSFNGIFLAIKNLLGNKQIRYLLIILFFERYFLSSLDSTYRFKLIRFGFDKSLIFLLGLVQLPSRIGASIIYQKYLSKYDFKYYHLFQYFRLIPALYTMIIFYLIEYQFIGFMASVILVFFKEFIWWSTYIMFYTVKCNHLLKICPQGHETLSLSIMNSVVSIGINSSFTVNLIIADHLPYYWFLAIGIVGHLVFTIIQRNVLRKYKID